MNLLELSICSGLILICMSFGGMTILNASSTFKSITDFHFYASESAAIQSSFQKATGDVGDFSVYDTRANAVAGAPTGLTTSGGAAVRLTYRNGNVAVIWVNGSSVIYENVSPVSNQWTLLTNATEVTFGIIDPQSGISVGCIVMSLKSSGKWVTYYGETL